MKSHFIPARHMGVAAVMVSAAALWGFSPHAAATPPQTMIFQRRPPGVPTPTRFYLGSVPRSEPTTARRADPPTTLYAAGYAPAPQPSAANIARSQQVIVRPPVYASVDRTASIDANGASRSRLVLPVPPQGAPQVSEPSISPAPAEVSIAAAKPKQETVMKAVPVWPEAPDQPDYGTPIFGRPGFVHPPGLTADATAVVDVRGFAAGQKVRDPRNGHVFLVPPQ